MYRVTKQFEFPAAHVLSRHPGRCRFPHGHNYTIEITLRSETLDDNFMVCDFHALKALLAEFLDSLDHGMMLNSDDQPNVQAQRDNPRRVLFDRRDPTSEVIAETIYHQLQNQMRKGSTITVAGVEYKLNPNAVLEKIRVWESSSAWAEYQP